MKASAQGAQGGARRAGGRTTGGSTRRVTSRSAVAVGVVMGSDSDWTVMQHAVAVLTQFGVAHEAKVVSAHRTPDAMFAYAARARARGLACIIAGAGGAAHLPGMIAAKTTLPVLGVPVPSRHLQGQDSLLSIVQMPRGVPVATFAIGEAGAVNAALFAVSMLARGDATLAKRLAQYRAGLARKVAAMTLPVAGAAEAAPAPAQASTALSASAAVRTRSAPTGAVRKAVPAGARVGSRSRPGIG